MRFCSNRGQKGAILITSLWILAILTVLSIGFAYRMTIELKLVELGLDTLRGHYSARAGITKAIYEIWRDKNLEYDSSNEEWYNCPESFKEQALQDGIFTVTSSFERGERNGGCYGVLDEERRININMAGEDILENIFEEESEIVASVLDWLDKDDEARAGGAENSYYQTLTNPYQCKNGNFEIIEELLLVKGVTPAIFLKVKHLITTYGDGKVNINTCEQEVLKCLGFSESLIDKILSFRSGSDRTPGTEDDKVFTNVEAIQTELMNFTRLAKEEVDQLSASINKQLFSVKSSFFKINSQGTTSKGKVKMEITAIVKRQEQKPPEIVYWYEN